MKTVSLLVLLTITSLVWSQEPKKEKVESPTIQLFSKAKDTEKGLQIEIVGAATLTAGGKAAFSYRITNLLDEEVFVELPSDLRVGYKYEGPPGGVGAGGGSFTIFPDNVNLLKRLHASSYSTGQRFTCGCAMASSNATAELPEFATAKGKVTVTIFVNGFYRSNGKAFCESIELPLPLKDK